MYLVVTYKGNEDTSAVDLNRLYFPKNKKLNMGISALVEISELSRVIGSRQEIGTRLSTLQGALPLQFITDLNT